MENKVEIFDLCKARCKECDGIYITHTREGKIICNNTGKTLEVENDYLIESADSSSCAECNLYSQYGPTEIRKPNYCIGWLTSKGSCPLNRA